MKEGVGGGEVREDGRCWKAEHGGLTAKEQTFPTTLDR